MSGIYIPGERMPDTLTAFWVFPSRYVRVFGKNGDEIRGREAILVPDHGRLIDADALAVHKFAGAEHDISIADGGACYRRGWNDAIEAIIENAETIIGGE